ncbi:hypothetical protein [Rubinisphaera italica]|uniref:Uncharacterized protein n=1 Tax=Rubinisphaera italica TaxID=2527969 RepID=A0A5C5XGP9_9PLAN|nr:hypothetical protein [Rubinisphaera italica]TWT62160.1 hypothetical protein Pan54_29010 [Rubinisphaera italica]
MAQSTRVDRFKQYVSDCYPFGVLILLAFVVVLGCDSNNSSLTEQNPFGEVYLSEEKFKKEVYKNEENYKIVSNAATVEAFTIDPSSQWQSWGQATVEDYPIIEGPVGLNPEIASEFINFMTSKKSFNVILGAKGCRPMPGVRIKFTGKVKSIDVLICFLCAHLGVFEDGELIGWGDFDCTEKRLIRLVQSVFPDDPKIQELSK